MTATAAATTTASDRPALDWRRVETVLLDMDGTLLDLHYDNYFWTDYLIRRHARAIAAPEEEVRDWLLPHMKALRATLPWYCVEYWSRKLGTDVMRYKAEVADRIAWRPRARAFLDALVAAGKRRVLVTNAHPRVVELKFARTGLGRYLDAVYSCHEFGHPKEEPAFWRDLARVEPVDPARTALFDDNERALAQAGATGGIRHLYGIVQPDLRRPGQTWTRFPAVEDFRRLEPTGVRGVPRSRVT